MMNSTITSTLPEFTSPFDIFLYARIPALDEHLSPVSQSIFLELVFWSVAYLIYAETFSVLVRYVLSKMSLWQGPAKSKVGVFCWNAQDDLVLLAVLAVHRLTAGCMCALGVYNNDANMWRHGYLLEVGFELADLCGLILKFYPHRHENIKPEIKVAIVFHHLPGVILGAMLLQSGLHHNEHIREIAFWLLVGAAGTCAGGIFVHLQDLDKQMVQATLALALNLAFFIYCRFFIFPQESLLVLQDVKADAELNESWTKAALQGYGFLMSLFNIVMVAGETPRIFKYSMRTLDGVTEVEMADVPLSREDRWKQEAKLSGASKKVL